MKMTNEKQYEQVMLEVLDSVMGCDLGNIRSKAEQ
jgi:hypothetical protein